MSRWVVSVPVWGERYERVFLRYTLPAIIAAANHLNEPVTLALHTNNPALADSWKQTGREAKAFGLAQADPFVMLSTAHRQALAIGRARADVKVVLLTADMVMSTNALIAARAHLRAGKRCICVMGMRVNEPTEEQPPYSDSAALLAWGWERRHRMVREATWPDGKSYDVWRMYFERGDNAICRLFLPHPLVVVPHGGRREMRFNPTIDVDLVNNFPISHIHLVTNPQEASVIELSPPEKEFVWGDTMLHRYDTRGPSCPSFIPCIHPHRRNFFSQAILIKGSAADIGDAPVLRRVLEGR